MFTASRIAALQNELKGNASGLAVALFADDAVAVQKMDTTDGLRITFSNSEIIHFRPSGNAPELRCYNEADSEERTQVLNDECMKVLAAWP